jgi:hypothetical protein
MKNLTFPVAEVRTCGLKDGAAEVSILTVRAKSLAL